MLEADRFEFKSCFLQRHTDWHIDYSGAAYVKACMQPLARQTKTARVQSKTHKKHHFYVEKNDDVIR